MSGYDHEALENLLPAYALEALDDEERRAVERHLADCANCRARLAEYRAVGEALLRAPDPVTPPPRVRAGLIARLAEEGREPTRPARLAWLRALSPWAWLGSLGLALLLALNVALLAETRALRQEQARLAEQVQVGQTALALAAYPESRTVVFQENHTGGVLLYHPERPVAVLYAWGVDPPPPGQAYQAWLIRPDGSRVSAGLFRASAKSEGVWILLGAPAPLQEFVGFGVTVEPETGSPGPTGPRVMGADF